MPLLFSRLDLIEEIEPHGAALNMALDEALLHRGIAPTLRTYRWSRPAVSFGCFHAFEPVKGECAGREIVRRWTGGGTVLHGEDFTYSLIVPREFAGALWDVRESYRAIHESVAEALERCAVSVSLSEGADRSGSAACFENPVQFDLLAAEGKVAGAAQRRTRAGLLHQGSIQLRRLPEGFPVMLASSLAGEICRRELSPEEVDFALSIEPRYASREWLEKR